MKRPPTNVGGLFYIEEITMSSIYRSNRKAKDEDIIRLNSVGLSLATIAEELNCHPTTITLRLKSLGIQPADTRRAFMEDVLKMLTTDQQQWLVEEMSTGNNIKDYVKELLVTEYQRQNPKLNQGN